MNIVLLQGPIGPFFQTLSNIFIEQDHRVFKFSFQGGDECWPADVDFIRYTNTPDKWSLFFSNFCRENNIDAVICYSDCRFYHEIAVKVCKQQGIQVWVLEEGYFRPDFITLEQGGVNANSPLYAERHRLVEYQSNIEFELPFVAGKTFTKRAWFASRQHITCALYRFRYPSYVNHRPWNLLKEASSWMLGGIIKIRHKKRDRKLLHQLEQHKGKIFLLPLQISEDFQIRHHSNFTNMNQVINKVIHSFSQNASSDDYLVIKHHPMDRGYISYRLMIDEMREKYQLGERLVYGYEFPLPKLYPLLKGVITVNSTVGLSALLHTVPVKCLGKALYDIPKLTTFGALSGFWKHQTPVCEQTFNIVYKALLHQTQINGNFYTKTQYTASIIAQRVTKSINKKRVKPQTVLISLEAV